MPIRPPGALLEPDFRDVCQRCGACREACEPGALLELGEAYGGAQGTPGFFPASSPCVLCPELPCAKACPSGALVLPESPAAVRMGTAVVDLERCYDVRGMPCDECALQCPTGIKAIRMGSQGPQVDADLCTGCGICVQACPQEPSAIRVVPRGLGG
jgi:ferredoxin-type protein NapG